MSKNDFKILVGHLLFIYRQFCLSRIMHREIETDLYRKFPVIWNTILLSLENDFLLGLAKVFEKEKMFKNITRSDSHKDVVKRIKELRKKLFAHFDTSKLRAKQDFLSKNKLNSNEIAQLFNALIKSVDQLKRSFDMQEDLSKLFIQTKKGVQNEFHEWLKAFQHSKRNRSLKRSQSTHH